VQHPADLQACVGGGLDDEHEFADRPPAVASGDRRPTGPIYTINEIL